MQLLARAAKARTQEVRRRRAIGEVGAPRRRAQRRQHLRRARDAAWLNCGVAFKTLQFLAPAITTELFKQTCCPAIKAKRCPHPSMYILSDVGERDDDVWAYGKSLLYLVSNAFEGRRDQPMLGMERFLGGASAEDPAAVDDKLRTLFAQKVDGLPSLVIAGARRRRRRRLAQRHARRLRQRPRHDELGAAPDPRQSPRASVHDAAICSSDQGHGGIREKRGKGGRGL